MGKLAFTRSLILLALPVFISISINSSEIFFNRNIWEIFSKDSFSLPVGLIWFFIIYIKKLPYYIKNNLLIVIYILALVLLEYTFGEINIRSFVEKINILIFFIFLQMISQIKISNDQIILLRKYSFILSSVVMLFWFINADFTVGRGGKLFLNLHTYDFEQYGAFLIYCVFVVSSLYIKFNLPLLIINLWLVGLLYSISFSRILYLPILIIIFLVKSTLHD